MSLSSTYFGLSVVSLMSFLGEPLFSLPADVTAVPCSADIAMPESWCPKDLIPTRVAKVVSDIRKWRENFTG